MSGNLKLENCQLFWLVGNAMTDFFFCTQELILDWDLLIQTHSVWFIEYFKVSVATYNTPQTSMNGTLL